MKVGILPTKGILDDVMKVDVGAVGREAESTPDEGLGIEELDAEDKAGGTLKGESFGPGFLFLEHGIEGTTRGDFFGKGMNEFRATRSGHDLFHESLDLGLAGIGFGHFRKEIIERVGHGGKDRGRDYRRSNAQFEFWGGG
jgi:hypothetical protein